MTPLATAIPSRSEIRGLDGRALLARLSALANEDRRVEISFVVHLEEFERRRLYELASCRSSWVYLRGKLGLLEGAASRRIAAARILRRFPFALDYLLDGRLWVSTLAQLKESLLSATVTPARATELLDLASGKSTRELEDALAKLNAPVVERASLTPKTENIVELSPELAKLRDEETTPRPSGGAPPEPPAASGSGLFVALAPPVRDGMKRVSSTQFDLTLTIDEELAGMLRELDELVANHGLAELVKRCVRNELTNVKKRMGAAPVRTRARPDEEKSQGAAMPAPQQEQQAVASRTYTLAKEPTPTKAVDAAIRERDSDRAGKRTAIPRWMRRAVYERDGGCCQFPLKGGRICGSKRHVEPDHVKPVALGGETTMDNLRLVCREHNQRLADEAFGEAFMSKFRPPK